MKKIISVILAVAAVVLCLAAFTSCGSKKTVIAVPNDTTNETRALQLLEVQGLIKLKLNADSTATIRDIVENPYNIEFKEIAAVQLPNMLKDVDYAVINSNYAIGAGLTPFVTEGTNVSYPNIIACKAGNEESAKIKALVAAVNSQKVKDFIEESYKGAVVCDLTTVTDGFDATVDYEQLKGTTIVIAASPTPHCDILKIAKEILKEKNITLDIKEFTDYELPNTAVEDREADANFFQHIPYMEDFNKKYGTHIVSVLEVHHEPMGIYSDKYDSLDYAKESK